MLVFLNDKNFWVLCILKNFNGIVLSNNTFLFFFSLLSFVFLRLSLLHTAAVCSFIRMVLSCINTPRISVSSSAISGYVGCLQCHGCHEAWCYRYPDTVLMPVCKPFVRWTPRRAELLDRRMRVSSGLPNNSKLFSRVVVCILFSTSGAKTHVAPNTNTQTWRGAGWWPHCEFKWRVVFIIDEVGAPFCLLAIPAFSFS